MFEFEVCCRMSVELPYKEGYQTKEHGYKKEIIRRRLNIISVISVQEIWCNNRYTCIFK